ncbi:MAG: multidrug ABC transporter ATP-binding protein [Planctomycetaceae bacterium]|nr:multidrug ABC transporter ATP-binding protein [Planctomycetaceae bacterium]
MIELRRLFRFFGSTRAVNDVSFTVSPGQVFGFIGPNGAGKTTTMRILSTLDLPSHGDAFVDGFSVINDPDRVRLRLGFMPDFFGTYANVDCLEYLDFFARSYGLAGTARRRALSRTLSFTGLDELAEKSVRALSKGMKQRLCLGRAMIHDPAALILDEPASGLDPRARIELRRMIRELASEGKAILVSSHILSELAEMCDQIGIIERGRILAIGSVDEVLQGQAAQRTIRIRVLEGAGSLVRWLTGREALSDVVADGAMITFGHQGDRHDEAELLRDLIQAGFAVSEFSSQKKSLEDVFMHVTTGAVQ